MTEAKPSSSLLGAARVAIALGTIGALAYFAFDLVSIAFRLGTRTGVRSAVGVALPLLAGSYAIVSRRGAPGAMGGPPAAVRSIQERIGHLPQVGRAHLRDRANLDLAHAFEADPELLGDLLIAVALEPHFQNLPQVARC